MLIAHLTDTHIKARGRLAYGRVDTAAFLATCVEAVCALPTPPDVAVMTGDLVDLGTAEEYRCFRDLVAPLPCPLIVVAGNHDDREALRAAFADQGLFPREGFLQFVCEEGPVRLIGLDTLVPGQGGGALCADRLAWFEETLALRPDVPTVVLMHHPPFETGIGHMDRIGLSGREAFAEIVARHPQIVRILCGHLHRPIQTLVGGRLAMTGPSPAHQVTLDLRPEAPSSFVMEPPGFLVHRWHQGQMVSHSVAIGSFAGPYPFFDASGRLID